MTSQAKLGRHGRERAYSDSEDTRMAQRLLEKGMERGSDVNDKGCQRNSDTEGNGEQDTRDTSTLDANKLPNQDPDIFIYIYTYILFVY